MSRSGAKRCNFGFTIIETIMVMVIVSVLWAVIAISRENLTLSRARVAVNRIVSDIRYAQSEARKGQLRTWVVFDNAAESYTLYSGVDKVARTVMTHPFTRKNYVVELDQGEFAGVEITGTSIGGGSELEFDSMGTPFNGNGQRLISDGTVTVTGGIEVVVLAGTGVVEAQ